MAPPQSKRSPGRPSSVSLRAPRSASVQQLVSRWESQPDAEGSATPPAPHHALLASALNATNGTLGPLDWTPRYGLPTRPPRFSSAARDQPPRRGALSPNEQSTDDPFADQHGIASHRQPRPHLMPLRSVHPPPTIPSPVSPDSSASPSIYPPRPPHALHSSWPTAPSPPPSPPPSTLDPPIPKHSSSPSSGAAANRPSLSTANVVQGESIVDATRSTRSTHSIPNASHRPSPVAQPPRSTVASQQPEPHALHTTRDPHAPEAPATHAPALGAPLHSPAIFDLEAKVPLGTGGFLPCSFRTRLPEAASIPERSSSHLSRAPANDEWSNEDTSSIPLLPAHTTEASASQPHAQPHKWTQLVADELANNAVCSDVEGAMLPISADEVFRRDAPPIHLPALEEYLSNRVVFDEPLFSASQLVCTPQEMRLFGLDEPEADATASSIAGAQPGVGAQPASTSRTSRLGSRSAHLEVAGGQISCPAVIYSSSADSDATRSSKSRLRHRRKQNKHAQTAPAETSDAKRGADEEKAGGLASDPLLDRDARRDERGRAARHEVATDDPFDDAHAELGQESQGDAKLLAHDAAEAEHVASRISARITASRSAGARNERASSRISERTPADGVSSKFSTLSKPLTRKRMFPPLMLLKQNSLDELKSNAIGPRKPPGGLWAVGWLGIVFDMVIGVEGSTFAAGILRLETLRDLFQIMTLQLHFQRYFASSDPTTTPGRMAKWVLQTLPAVLGFDLVSVFGYALVFFVVWIALTALALWRFWHMTRAHNPNKTVEGFDSQGWIYRSASRGTRLANTCLVFALGLLYLPLSKLAVDALVWSSDFWPVPNPYKGGVDRPDPGPLLGDPDIWRAPLDFCYTTTMRKDAFNWAYVVLPLAVLTIVFYTLWYPYKLMMTIREMLPRVSTYNELGRRRSDDEMQIYYQRLLNRDKSPFNFLYNSYHRRWGYYKPLYILLFKLTNLLVVGVLAKDNCLFRSVATRTMLVVQQSTLIVVMTALLALHMRIRPFVDKIGNRSEMVSRIGYVLTATIGLLVALNVQGSTVYNTTILYLVQAFTYGGNIYFALIGMSFVAHHVKRWQNRVDYTIDMFSPLLDMTKHIKRRVWQETLSILLLSAPELHMPLEQVIAFSVSDDERWPPYLIDFRGSVAERHIENLKILKHIGIHAYRAEVDFARTAPGARRDALVHRIQSELTGPDVYYRPTAPAFASGVLSFFGKAFVVPFPPTVVVCYDEGGSVVLTEVDELEALVAQNGEARVQSRKRVRQALRALEGQRVLCPYVDSVQVGDATSGMVVLDKLVARLSRRRGALPRFGGRSAARVQADYVLATPVSYVEGTLRIERRHEFDWAGYNFDGGFDVSIVYDAGRTQDATGTVSVVERRLVVSASRAFGLTEDFELTPALSRFLQDNETAVVERAPLVERMLHSYRRDFAREARWKARVLPYSFLTDVFDNDGLSPLGLRMALVETGCGRSMRNLPMLYEGCVTLMYERLAAINRTPVHRFWWLLFDELWRLNSSDYAQLRKHRTAFSPQYPSSIAYRPMPRSELECFLAQRGLWHQAGAKGGPFNRGLLNRLYFYLNEIVFAGHHDGRVLNPRRGWSADPHGEAEAQRGAENPLLDPVGSDLRRAATIKVGLAHDATHATRRDISTIDDTPAPDAEAPATGARRRGGDRSWGTTAASGTASQFTGGGTAYSTDSIVVRTAYRWEQRLDGYATDTRWQRFGIRALQWLSLHPVELKLERDKLFLYLKLVDAPEAGKVGKRYELLKPSCRRPAPGQDGAM